MGDALRPRPRGAARSPRAAAASRAVAALALAGVLLSASACSKVTTGTGGAARNAAGPIPGVLRYADIQEPESLSTIVSTQIVTADLSYLLFSYFFNYDDHDNFVPEIALELPSHQNGGISADEKTITYHVRHGVRWQDGVPLTARDVVFTYHAIMNPRNNVQVQTGYDQIASVTAPDDYTVVVHMKRVFSPILAYFMCMQGGFNILPAHLLERYPDINHVAWNNAPIGSGPFKFAEWVHGDHITLVANPLYWRGPPHLSKIVFRVVPDTNTIVTQLQTHEIDAWFRADPPMYGQLKKIPGYRVLVSPENVFGHLDFNVQDPILRNVDVRRAITSAIDRERLVADTTSGVYERTDTDQSVFSWANDHHAPFSPYDPAKARALLDAAGWKPGPDGIRQKNGVRLSLQLSYIGGQSIAQKLAALIQQEAKAVGIEITQKPYTSQIYFAAKQDGGILNSGKYQLAYYGWVSGVDPDNSSLYRCIYFPPAGQNSLFWCDQTVEQAEIDALSTMDQARRKRDYRIISTELGEQAPTVFLFAERRLDIVPDGFDNFRPSPAESAFWNAWQWSMR